MIRPAVLVLMALAGCGSSDTGIRTTPQALSPTGSGKVQGFAQGPQVAVDAAKASEAKGHSGGLGGNEYNRNAETYRGVFAGALAATTAR